MAGDAVVAVGTFVDPRQADGRVRQGPRRALRWTIAADERIRHYPLRSARYSNRVCVYVSSLSPADLHPVRPSPCVPPCTPPPKSSLPSRHRPLRPPPSPSLLSHVLPGIFPPYTHHRTPSRTAYTFPNQTAPTPSTFFYADNHYSHYSHIPHQSRPSLEAQLPARQTRPSPHSSKSQPSRSITRSSVQTWLGR